MGTSVQTLSEIFTAPGDRLLGFSCKADPCGELNARLLKFLESTNSSTSPSHVPEDLSDLYAQHQKSVTAFTKVIADQSTVETPSQKAGLTYRSAQKLCLKTMPDYLRDRVFETILSNWVIESAPNRNRSVAAARIRECYHNKRKSSLDLRCLNLTSLPNCLLFCSHLRALDCSYNQLMTLPALPPGLTELDCGLNRLMALPDPLPDLRYLDCCGNRLRALPELPSGLIDLNCSNNQLKVLPALPPGLLGLYCWKNQLLALPHLPSGLRRLYCWGNRLQISSVSLSQLGIGCNIILLKPVSYDQFRKNF